MKSNNVINLLISTINTSQKIARPLSFYKDSQFDYHKQHCWFYFV